VSNRSIMCSFRDMVWVGVRVSAITVYSAVYRITVSFTCVGRGSRSVFRPALALGVGVGVRVCGWELG